ncbi:MAG TPA: hypothetical protein VLK33_11130 [Terriglobales bacterium]|nr:hypothetical protein [Terriglobales bacterium]
MMDIRPSTKLRQILAEMVADELLVTVREDNAGVCGFRLVYELNYAKPGYSEPHENRHAVKQERAIRLNMSGKTELLVMS